jgi:hypothetical protein
MSNIEVMYPVYYKKTERSDSTIRQSSFVNRHSLKFHTNDRKYLSNSENLEKQ